MFILVSRERASLISLFTPSPFSTSYLAIRIKACLKMPLQKSFVKSSKEHFPSLRTEGSTEFLMSSRAFSLSVTIFSYSRKSSTVLAGISMIFDAACS